MTHFPRAISRACGNGRARLYDECGSQTQIYQDALAEARASGKTLLISYGAEWCIWCHVFDAHLAGATGRFSYPVENRDVTLVERSGSEVVRDAEALNAFAAQNFVVANIEADLAPDGAQVLQATGASGQFEGAYPLIYSVTRDGRWAATFNDDAAEVRRDEAVDWYRGYDRKALLGELVRLRDASLSSVSESEPDQVSRN